MPSWAIIVSAIIVVILIATILYLWVLVRNANNPEEMTREQFALKCLPAIVGLVSLGIATISSKDGVADQIMKLIAAILGHPLAESSPAPLSEKILIFAVLALGFGFLYKLHANWKGPTSVDEEEAKRLKQNTSLIPQLADELRRVCKRKPARVLYFANQKIDPLTLPTEPNPVWHEHARELFELWQPKVSFTDNDRDGWDIHNQCWVGQNRQLKAPLFLFCVRNTPTPTEIKQFTAFANSISKASNKLLYVVYQSDHAIFEEKIGYTLVSEEYLYQHIVDFSDYFHHICKQVERERLPNSDLTIKDIFTPSSISTDTKGENVVSTNLGEYLSDWAKAPPGKQLALLGEYGQGKSTGAQMFVYEAIKSDLVSCNGRVPILLELRGKSPMNLPPAELLDAWGGKYKLQAQGLMKLLVAGRLIIIFEGFDEMANIATLNARVGHFRSLWQFAFSKSKVMFTGRRNMFFDDDELYTMFRKDALDKLSSMCQVLHLCPFDMGKINDGLRWANQTTRDEIINATQTNSQLLDIIARPSLLFLVGNLWADLRKELANEKFTSAHVIDHFIMTSFARQVEKENNGAFTALTPSERRYFHEGIALFMSKTGATNQIGKVDLNIVIEKLYKTYPENIHILPEIDYSQKQLPLKQRNKDNEHAIEQIVTDIRTHGILVNDWSQSGAFKFAHKSFYELLIAKISALSILTPKSVFYSSILAATNHSVDFPKESPEIMRFFSEIFIARVQNSSADKDIIQALFVEISAQFPVMYPFRNSLTKNIDAPINLWLLKIALSRVYVKAFMNSFYDIAMTSMILLMGIMSSFLVVLTLIGAVVEKDMKGKKVADIAYHVEVLKIREAAQSKSSMRGSLEFPILLFGVALIYIHILFSLKNVVSIRGKYSNFAAILFLSANKKQTYLYVAELNNLIGVKSTNILLAIMKEKYGSDLVHYP